jgi:hypothetical protein
MMAPMNAMATKECGGIYSESQKWEKQGRALRRKKCGDETGKQFEASFGGL